MCQKSLTIYLNADFLLHIWHITLKRVFNYDISLRFVTVYHVSYSTFNVSSFNSKNVYIVSSNEASQISGNYNYKLKISFLTWILLLRVESLKIF
jgi:hypothetical protein